MMDKYVAISLPIVWAIVATILALVLYRTSESLFEETRTDERKVRKLRLVGSIVIFSVIFLALAQYSPTKLIYEMALGQERVAAVDMQRLAVALDRLHAANDELVACAAISTVQECNHKLNDMQSKLLDVHAGLTRLQQSGK